MTSFVQIFYDPGAVFARVKERGSWAAPLVMAVLIIMIFTAYVSQTIGMENMTRRFFDEHPSFVSRIPPDKLEETIRQSGSPARLVMGSVSAGLMTAVVTLIIALVLMMMLFIMDRRPGLPQMLGTVAWAMFPFVVMSCVMGVLILLFSRDPTELDPRSLLATNVGALLDKNSTGKFAFSIASSLDLLAIGKVLFLSFGTSKVAGLPFSRSLALVTALWVMWVLLRGGFQAAVGF